MGQQYSEITDYLKSFIEKQKMFFVGTAARDGRVNVSPKGMDTLRVLGPNRVVWLNLTGSGNETAAHLADVNRMTLMFCAFEGKPIILRFYGSAAMYYPADSEWKNLKKYFPDLPGARQIFDLQIDLVQTSCGFGVPLMTYSEDRDTLTRCAENKGPDGIRDYWEEKNTRSIDGKSISFPDEV